MGGTTLEVELLQAADETVCFCEATLEESLTVCQQCRFAASLRARAARVLELVHAWNGTGVLPNGVITDREMFDWLTGPLPGTSGGAGDSKRRETKP